MSGVMRAGPPLLFTAKYPIHRAKLLAVAHAIANSCPAFRVRLGRRLLEEPEDEMRRLLELTKR
jgi:hypothetical protein